MSGFTTRLLVGLAELLAGAGVASWRPNGPPYTDTETGLVLRVIPQSPDRVITLSTYGVDDDPTLSDDIVGIQVRTRSAGQDPADGEDLADAVFDELHGLDGVTLSTGLRLGPCWRQSTTPLGQDTAGRHERSCNYYVTAHRPSPHRT